MPTYRRYIFLIFCGLIFNTQAQENSYNYDREKDLISLYGKTFKSDLSVTGKIEDKYYKCTRKLVNESVRKALSDGTYEYTIKIGKYISIMPKPFRHGFDHFYDYTTVNGINIYGYGELGGYSFLKEGVLLTSDDNYDCIKINSFFEESKAKLLFMVND